MYFTFSLKDIAILALIFATLIMVIYLIKVLRQLLVTLKTSNEILGNVESITDVAEKRTEAVDLILDGITKKLQDMASSRSGKDTVVKQLSIIANAITTIIGSFGCKKNKKTEDMEEDVIKEDTSEKEKVSEV